MLCSLATYSPTVLFARQRVRGAHVEQHDPAYGRSGVFSPGIYRLLLIEDGSCRVDTRAGELVLRAGQVGLFQPGFYHDLAMAHDSRAILVGFVVIAGPELRRSGRSLSLADESHYQPSAQEVWDIDLPSVLKGSDHLVDDIRHIAAKWWQDDYQHFRANHLLAQLLYNIIESQRQGDHRIVPDKQHWLSQVQQLIDERLPYLHHTADLAAVYNRNPKAFARSFKHELGVSPAVYIRRRRLERTIDLVRSTRLPIKTIAEQVGYRHVAALDHAWRQRFDMPPLQWRQQFY